MLNSKLSNIVRKSDNSSFVKAQSGFNKNNDNSIISPFTFINIIENFDSDLNSNIKSPSSLSPFETLRKKDSEKKNNQNKNQIVEFKYILKDKKILRMHDQSIEKINNKYKKSKNLSIDTYTSGCKHRKSKCHALNISHSRFSFSIDNKILEGSGIEKSTDYNSSDLKSKSSKFSKVPIKINDEIRKISSLNPRKKYINERELKLKNPIISSKKITIKVEINNFKKNSTIINKFK